MCGLDRQHRRILGITHIQDASEAVAVLDIGNLVVLAGNADELEVVVAAACLHHRVVGAALDEKQRRTVALDRLDGTIVGARLLDERQASRSLDAGTGAVALAELDDRGCRTAFATQERLDRRHQGVHLGRVGAVVPDEQVFGGSRCGDRHEACSHDRVAKNFAEWAC
ncbi:hypothetical protein D3C87_1498520 [compost metagenome]